MSAMRVLVADDEPSIRYVLRETLEEEGCEVVDVDNGDRALEELVSGRYQLAFLDIRMPGPSGLELLERVATTGSETSLVIITAQNTMENAVEAMKRGALDYPVKPFSLATATTLAQKALRTRRLHEELRDLRREVGRGAIPGGGRLVGKSPAMLEIFKTIGKVAIRNVPVLITGESGTGKELVAHAIHAASPRATAPFVVVNAAAIPLELLESELFGHERGAFTGAVEARSGRFRDASGGTLFLDEIGDMPVSLQAKLLRVLQSGEVTAVGARRPEHVDVRIVAATHRDLEAMVSAGEFREDLLFRLSVLTVELPPLRERTADISRFIEHFADEAAAALGRPVVVTDEAVAAARKHPWPGNVRELGNVVERLILLAEDGQVSFEDLPAEMLLSPSAADGFKLPAGGVNWEALEQSILSQAMESANGNRTQAAKMLGLSYKAFLYRLEKHELG